MKIVSLFLRSRLCATVDRCAVVLKSGFRDRIGYETVPQLDRRLPDYFLFYNEERPHQGLDNRLPADLYFGKETPIENKKCNPP